MPDDNVDEFTLIRDLIAPLARHPGARKLIDDGAVIGPSSGMEFAVTKDMMAEGVHFLPDDPPGMVARKLLRTNLSDLAAMGARPLGYLLGLASDGRRSEAWYTGFFEGLARDQQEFGISLLGGDTIAAKDGLLTLSLTAFGEVPPGRSFTRDRVRPGDIVAVTGTIGDAALGLLVRTGALPGLGARQDAELEQHYLLPEPRVSLGAALLDIVHGAIDISDGLLADAMHLAQASGVTMDLLVEEIPFSDSVRLALDGDPALLHRVLTGGDDYELLLTMAPGDLDRAAHIAATNGIRLTRIGRCRRGVGLNLLRRDGTRLEPTTRGWSHTP